MENKYRDDLVIDENNLHMECMMQPQLYMKYAELYATAAKTKSELKQKLEILESELDSYFRTELADKIDSGEKIKITEKLVLSMIRQHKDYQSLSKELLNAEYEENIYKDAKEAFKDRKLQLGNLTDLFISGYFAKPSQKTKEQNTQNRHRENLNRRGEEE